MVKVIQLVSLTNRQFVRLTDRDFISLTERQTFDFLLFLFRGYHKCGATLLSAPTPGALNPIILVSAAHCNFVCKVK